MQREQQSAERAVPELLREDKRYVWGTGQELELFQFSEILSFSKFSEILNNSDLSSLISTLVSEWPLCLCTHCISELLLTPALFVCICSEQVISPQCIPATVAPSLLMSPMVFTQPTCSPSKERDSGLLSLGSQEPAATSTSLFLPLQSPEPSALSPLTKLQLQEALLFLIQVGGPSSLFLPLPILLASWLPL